MTTQTIFILQFSMSLLVFGLLANWVLAPKLAQQTRRDALMWLTMPHAFRHMGMVFLVPGVVAQPLPDYLANPTAYGDLLTAGLALVALFMLRARSRGKLAAVWLFNMVGTADLVLALRHPEVVAGFGAAWYIPTFVVPLLLVTHVMIFARLLRTETKPAITVVAE